MNSNSNNLISLIFVLFAICVTTSLARVNYCDSEHKKFCEQYDGVRMVQKDHIGCTHRGWHSRCQKQKILPMSTRRKNLLLKLHNRLRNKVAAGKLPGFNSAKAMNTLVWDDELAYLAELNVQQCHMKHEDCRATKRFPKAGQNLGVSGYPHQFEGKNNMYIKKLVRAWFDEYKDAEMSDLISYTGLPRSRKVIGHFTGMVIDKATHVGCAMARYYGSMNERNPGKGYWFLLACNYSKVNMYQGNTYESGKACSGCKDGCHHVYKSLCKPEPEY
uniref:Putative antigen 5-related salivary protein n=1 Tax=Corethrella appendiculata TaxID=1370023 RepID=U5EX32_9DIPT